MKRGAAVLGAMCLIAACGGEGGHAPVTTSPSQSVTILPSPRILTTPQAPPAPRLMFVYALQPVDQLFSTLTVDANGGASAGWFIGEIAGVKHDYFRLGASALARLRRQLAPLRHVSTTRTTGGRTTLIYTITAGGRAVRFPANHVPRRIAPLLATISALIARYSYPP